MLPYPAKFMRSSQTKPVYQVFIYVNKVHRLCLTKQLLHRFQCIICNVDSSEFV